VPAIPGYPRRAWLLLKDPFATVPKGIRTLLLLAWLAWFPARQFGGDHLHGIILAIVAALAVFLLVTSLRNRRRAASEPEDALRTELRAALAKFRGVEGLLQGLVALLAAILARGLWMKARSGDPWTETDVATPSMGFVIIWGTIETILHHRRAARLAGE
jgi:hypothetical protein